MIVDTSALVAILLQEHGHEVLLEATQNARKAYVGVPHVLESVMVLTSRFGTDARPHVYALLRNLGLEIVPLTEEHMEESVSAFLRFGRGRHPAALNYGDCMAYALAVGSGMPLLYKGGDFSLTDVKSALA